MYQKHHRHFNIQNPKKEKKKEVLFSTEFFFMGL